MRRIVYAAAMLMVGALAGYVLALQGGARTGTAPAAAASVATPSAPV